MLLTDLSIRNRTTVAVLGVIIVLLGVSSYLSLPREAFPDIPIPYIMITTTYEGVSPEDVETAVTMKIEKELTGIRGVKEVLSSSAEGMSLISVEFTPDVPTEVALQRVRDRVDIARGELPQEIDEPVITEINIAEFPVMQISISGDVSPFQLKEIADDMEDALETVPGVLKVDVEGALEREIRLEMDPDRVAQYNLTIPEILALIPSENVNISAGGIETPGTKFNVRIPAEFVSPEEVDHLLLAVRDGKPIYLADVATVRDTFKDRESISRLNGQENVTLLVRKRIGANVVQVSDAVKMVVEEARKQIPGGVTFDVIYDMSKYIRNSVADLENNIAAALILVTGILVLFMGWRPSTIVAMIIPLSMLITFFLDPGPGLHVEHDRAVQPGAGSGHAGGQRNRDRGEHLSAHAARLQPDRRGHSGGQRSGLAGDHLDPDDRCRVLAHDAMARDHGRFHEVSADHADHRPDGLSVRRPDLQPGHLLDLGRPRAAKARS